MDENIFDLSPEAFQAAIAELRTMGYDTDDLTRQYRSANSPFAAINNAADNFQQGLADDGRRSVLGGLLSKVDGSTGMDAIRGLNFEGLGGLLGAGQAVGRAIDAPGAAAQGLIPRGDMAGEAMNVAGMAMGAGGAATAPGGALRSGLLRGDVVDLTAARADRSRNETASGIRGIVEDMQSGAYQQRIDAAGFDLHQGGAMPLQVGSRVNPPNSWDMPGDWSVDGYWVDPQNPQRYGYKLANGDGETYQAPVSDPSIGYRMDDPNRFGGGFTAFSGPRSNAISYPERPTPARTVADPITPEAQARISAEWDDLFGGINANASQSGGLLGAGLSEAQRQARDILDMRAAGRAGDVTDEMMARADPQYMYDNTPLPMDEASRLARANAGGFDIGTPLFHGTGADFQAFDTGRFQQSDFGTGGAGVYSSESPGLAGAYSDLVTRPSGDGANIMPITTRRADAYDNGGYRNINSYEDARAYSQRMQELGVDNVFYRDGVTGEIIENTTFNPTNIRSRFARFDPEFSHLSNLSAANASPAGLLAMQPEQETRPLPFMEMLRGLLQ
jgi:hypothetical protein